MVDQSFTTNRLSCLVGGFALLAVLVANVPPFLCMGLDCDTIAFDLYLRGMQEGKILYRDMTENNLPGVMWIHGITRELFGWSSVAIRAVDLVLIGSGLVLLAFWQRGIRLSSRLWILTFLLSFYFSTSEWNHCQRDPWMVLPTIGALFLRRTQLETIGTKSRGLGATWAYGALEGSLWGAAIWLKPYAVVPGALAWLMGTLWLARSGRFSFRAFAADLLGLAFGGLLVGGLGILWMISNGCWAPYLEHISSVGQDYLNADLCRPFTQTTCRFFQVLRFYPWSLIILGAVLFGMSYLVLLLFGVRSDASTQTLSQSLLVSLLLGFFIEAVFLQHVFDYAIVPSAFVAIAWVGSRVAASRFDSERWLLGFLCGLVVFMGFTPVLKQRLPVWERCIREGPTWEVKNHLNILERVSWADLKRVREFLVSQNVKDGELTIITEAALPLYDELGLHPPTKSVMMTNQLFTFPSLRSRTFETLKKGNQRFAIASTEFYKIDRDRFDEASVKEDEPLQSYWQGSRDWTKYVVFRAGQYVVLEMPGELMSDWCREVLGL